MLPLVYLGIKPLPLQVFIYSYCSYTSVWQTTVQKLYIFTAQK